MIFHPLYKKRKTHACLIQRALLVQMLPYKAFEPFGPTSLLWWEGIKAIITINRWRTIWSLLFQCHKHRNTCTYTYTVTEHGLTKKAYKNIKSSLATVGGRIRSAAYCKTYQLSGTCGKRPQEHNYCLNYTKARFCWFHFVLFGIFESDCVFSSSGFYTYILLLVCKDLTIYDHLLSFRIVNTLLSLPCYRWPLTFNYRIHII